MYFNVTVELAVKNKENSLFKLMTVSQTECYLK